MNAPADRKPGPDRKPRLGVVRPDTFEDEGQLDLFALQHWKLFPGSGLPDPVSSEGADLFEAWGRCFAERKITVEDAMEASRRLLLSPPRWPRDHLPALIRLTGIIREERDNAARLAAYEAQRPSAEEEMRQFAAVWDRLRPGDRAAIEERVRRRYVSLTAFRKMFLGLCLAEMSNDLESGRLSPPADPTADVCPTDFDDIEF